MGFLGLDNLFRTGNNFVNDVGSGFHALIQLLQMTVKYLPYMMILAGLGLMLQTVRTIKGK